MKVLAMLIGALILIALVLIGIYAVHNYIKKGNQQ